MPTDRRTVWTALTWSAAILAFVEIWRCVLFPTERQIAHLGAPELAAGVWSMTILALVAHLGPASLLLWSARRRVIILAAALYGLWWHVGIVQGDGIRSLDFYWPLRVMIASGAATGLAAFTHFVLLPGDTGDDRSWPRRMVALGVVVVGVRVNLHHFGLYREFQGLLVTFECVLLAWLLLPLAARPGFRRVAVGFAVTAIAATAVVAPERALVEGHVRRLCRITGPLVETLPLSRALLLPSERLVDPDQPLSAEQRASFAHAAEARRVDAHAPKGKNVLLIVLESVRADVWADPAVTPRFHEWRRHGTYFPVAIAQYPATPLAYGSMFTSQYPSVLAQSPHWGEHRLFDELDRDFDRLILSRPAIKWFDHNAVSNFFLDEDAPQHRHESAAEGLAHLRAEIEVAQRDSERYFAWAHLYEPHAPYQPHEDYEFGDDARTLYEGEVRWTDDALGDFMDWFWAQPGAEDTLVVVLGDHGEGLGETVHGERFFGHHVHVKSLVSHIPMFVAARGLPRGQLREDVRPAQIDLMPTVFDYLGRRVPASYWTQGRSIFAELKHPGSRSVVTEAFAIRGNDFFDFVATAPERDPQQRREAFRTINEVGAYSPKLGIEYDGWKLVYDTMLGRAWLYDLGADPMERQDLAARDPERVARMRERLETWRARQAWVLEQLEQL